MKNNDSKLTKGLLTKSLVSKCIGNIILPIGLLASSTLVVAKDSSALTLGTPDNFLQQVGLKSTIQNQKNPNKHGYFAADKASLSTQKFALVDTVGRKINVAAQNLFVEKDGTLSMSGAVTGLPGSEFILQRKGDDVNGWVILEQHGTAYKYTTVNGEIVVNEIDITDVRPVCEIGDHNHSLVGESYWDRFAAAEDSLLSAKADSPLSPVVKSSAASHLGSYSGQNINELESLPGAQHVILLDFSDFAVPNNEYVWTAWQVVAAGFSMLEVNVTTNPAVYDSAAPSKRGGSRYINEQGRSYCSFAYGTGYFCVVRKQFSAMSAGRIANHELGHLLHLSHDGDLNGDGQHYTYFAGLRDFEWATNMGDVNHYANGEWDNGLHQWSQGEYDGANNQQDDFAIMSQFIPFKPDDIATSTPLVLEADGSVLAANNAGQIERNTDSDSFTFSTGANGGRVNFDIDRTEHRGGGMLDVQATIKGSDGTVISQSNHSVDRSASFDEFLPTGNYTLEISGGDEGTPSHGFSNYSSIGLYAIEGGIADGDFINQCVGINAYPNWTQVDWEGTPTHALGGDVMKHDGNAYTANWWTSATPGNNADWTLLKACLVPATDTDPDPEPTCGNVNVYPDWPQGDHAAAGEEMAYEGNVYKANWWTAAIPETDTSWALVRACD